MSSTSDSSELIHSWPYHFNVSHIFFHIHKSLRRGLIFSLNWYCKNGLPSDLVSDRDKLFMSHFWKVLTKLTGISLKMLSTYHPETDGSSEHTNKTMNQLIQLHVDCNQKGWVCALPQICFCIMNTVNVSTGYSGFQLHLGWSPCLILPIVPTSLITYALLDPLQRTSLHESLTMLLMLRTTCYRWKPPKLHMQTDCVAEKLFTNQVTRLC